MVGISNNASRVTIAAKDPGIYTCHSTVDAEITISVKRPEKVYECLQAAVVCEERGGDKNRVRRHELLRVDVVSPMPRLTKGVHVLNCQLQLGNLRHFPSSMDLIENLGVFWWIEVYTDHSPAFVDQFPLAVFPTRWVDWEVLTDLDRSRYRVVKDRQTMIASLHENATPSKPKAKVFTAMFGDRHPHPSKCEMRELGVETKLLVPEAGVLQSPHKAHVGLHIRCADKKRVLLSKITIKLISKVEAVLPNGDHQPAGSETSIICLESSPDLVLPGEWLDVSDEIADLEIPPVSETTRTDMLAASYDLRVTLVFRAAHLSNFSRWMTIKTPVHVLPSVIEQFARPESPPPPPSPEMTPIVNSLLMPPPLVGLGYNGPGGFGAPPPYMG